MTADANAPKRERVQKAALRFCKTHYGSKGLKIGEQIHAKISWRPSFHFRKGQIIFGVEVSEVIDSTILRLVSSDILNFTRPVALCLACPLEALQTETERSKVKELRRIGIGLITIDNEGDGELQAACIPLAQHISEDLLSDRLRELSAKLKIAFRAAHETFSVTPGQGLQEAGQIVEAIVDSMAVGAKKKGKLSAGALAGTAADRIDALWEAMKPQRAALGGARAFLKTYRNIASHPARSAKEAMKKINGCRDGFFRAIEVAKDLSRAMSTLGYHLKLH